MLPLILFNLKIIDAGSMASATLTSQIIDISEVSCFAVQSVWDGATPIGTISYQASLDGTNFTEISNASVSGNTGSLLLNVVNPGYVSFRTVYTKTSGSGTLNIRMSAKR